MDDLISRQAAIDAINEQIEYCNKALGSFDISLKDEYAVKVERASLEVYKEQLENLSSAQPEPRWIPCAERMPKSGEPVLITYRTWRSYLRKYVYFVTIGWHANKHSVREDSFSEWEDDCDYDEDEDVFYIREGWYEFTTQGNCDHASWGICDAEVIAWMPLPKPYGCEQDG